MRRATHIMAVVIAATALTTAPSAARPMCFGRRATIVVDDEIGTVRGTPGRDVVVVRKEGFARRIKTGGGNDLVCMHGASRRHRDAEISTGRGDDRASNFGEGQAVLEGGAGHDRLHGGDGAEDLYGGRGDDALQGAGGSDAVLGGSGDDKVAGGDNGDIVAGFEGDDEIAGGSDSDLVWFNFTFLDEVIYDAGGVTVDLARGTASADDGRDSIAEVEHVLGSLGDDVLLGTSGVNRFQPLEGDDEVRLRGGSDFVTDAPHLHEDDDEYDSGDDSFVGGEGSDLISFSHADSLRTPVTVDLAAGTATGRGTDDLAGFEGVQGTDGDDSLSGDDAGNRLYGMSGDDFIDGRESDDLLVGGPDSDTCVNGEAVSECEALTTGIVVTPQLDLRTTRRNDRGEERRRARERRR